MPEGGRPVFYFWDYKWVLQESSVVLYTEWVWELEDMVFLKDLRIPLWQPFWELI